jgi:hypothetical protein
VSVQVAEVGRIHHAPAEVGRPGGAGTSHPCRIDRAEVRRQDADRPTANESEPRVVPGMALDDRDRLRSKVRASKGRSNEDAPDPASLMRRRDRERREHQDGYEARRIAHQVGGAHDEVADELAVAGRVVGRDELRDEGEVGQVAAGCADRGDQRRDLRIREGSQLELIEPERVGGRLRPDDERGQPRVGPLVRQRAGWAGTAWRPSGIGRCCSTGWM